LEQVYLSYTAANYMQLCDILAAQDADLATIIERYGYPPIWSRPNTFESLVHIVLEQQVSLASALAALNKLKEKIGLVIPEHFLELSDLELRDCYFSRQKISYVRGIAAAIQSSALQLETLALQSNDEIRKTLGSLKGIGNWTIDIYLMFILNRTDIFPLGDLAAVNALRRIKHIDKDISRGALSSFTAPWQPYRTIATMILWHYYLSIRKKQQ
jgi:DNA-3-methyladenine glycosylase II